LTIGLHGQGVLRHESLLHDIIKGRVRGKATRGRKRMYLLSALMKGKYVALKRTAADRKEKSVIQLLLSRLLEQLEMWANAQRDGHSAKHRWRPLFNAAKFG